MDPKFSLDAWLKTIDIWDEQYDYVMHDSHWLTTNWSSTCEKCLAKASKRKPEPIQPSATITSSPVKIASSHSLNSTTSNTLRPIESNGTPDYPPPPEPTIPFMTPIAPPQISNRIFVTPQTWGKNDTYTRNTRQSTRKLLNAQTAQKHQDLINLNETFDLYKSALAETPSELSPNLEPGDDIHHLSGLASINNGSTTVDLLKTPASNSDRRTTMNRPPSNFELLSNPTNGHTYNPVSLQSVDNHVYAPSAASRIPRIPVRLSRNNDY